MCDVLNQSKHVLKTSMFLLMVVSLLDNQMTCITIVAEILVTLHLFFCSSPYVRLRPIKERAGLGLKGDVTQRPQHGCPPALNTKQSDS